jgi:hypothetical protein
LLDYVSIAYENNILGMQLRSGNFDIEDLSEIAWSSQNLHQRLNLPLSEQESNQIQAGIIFISKNEFSLRFISQWLAIMREGNFQYLMGNNIGVSSRFKQHRYDQSIFSMLYKFSKLKAVDDETFFHPNWQEEGENYPIWAMRNRDGVDPFKLHFSDLIFKIVRRLNRFFHKYSL